MTKQEEFNRDFNWFMVLLIACAIGFVGGAVCGYVSGEDTGRIKAEIAAEKRIDEMYQKLKEAWDYSDRLYLKNRKTAAGKTMKGGAEK